jgi:hypothetical protein
LGSGRNQSAAFFKKILRSNRRCKAKAKKVWFSLVTKKLLEEPPSPNKKLVKKPTDKSPRMKGDAEGRKSKSMNKVGIALGGIGGLMGKGKGLASVLQRSSTIDNNGKPGQEPGSARNNWRAGVAAINAQKLPLKETSITEINSSGKLMLNLSTVTNQPMGPDKKSPLIPGPKGQHISTMPRKSATGTLLDLN